MANEVQENKATGADPLQPYRSESIRLFMRDANLRQQAQTILEKMLGFSNVAAVNIGQNAKENIEKLGKLIMTEEAHVLVSPPSTKDSRADTKIEALTDFLLSVQARVRQTGKDAERVSRYMSKIVPIFEEAENYQMRMKYIMALSDFRITDVFILPYPESKQPAEQIKERFPIMQTYITEHFTEKEKRLERIDASRSEAELTERKQQSQKLMRQGEDYKKTGNFEEAVQCFNKAIEIMPDDPGAYIESGRGYTKLQKYNRALQRFTEAEEVAEDLPAPNQEIAAVRIIQVKEMITQGKDPDSPEVQKLLDEAVGHYKAALGKASELKPLHQDDKTDRSAEAVSKIAGSIFKLELGEALGSRHASVKELGALARDSLQNAVKEGEGELPTSQMICLALADVDKGEFAAAETLLFKAAADKKYTQEACRELNYMGAQVRLRVGPDEAIRLYRKLLGIDPPNKAAIHYNFSVAMQASGNDVEAAGSIVQAVYTDPSLPQDDMFYKNTAVVSLMNRLVALFARVKENEGKLRPKNAPKPAAKGQASVSGFTPPSNPKFAGYCAKFEELMRNDRQRAYRVLYDVYQRAPEFFKSAEAYSNTPLMELVTDAHDRCRDLEHEGVRNFARYLAEVLEAEKELTLPADTRHEDVRQKLEDARKAGDGATARALYEAYRTARGFFAAEAAYSSAPVREMASQAVELFRDIADARIRGFIRFMETFQRRAEKFGVAQTGEEGPIGKLERLAETDMAQALDHAAALAAADPSFLDCSEAYESDAIAAFVRGSANGAPPVLVPAFAGYAALRDKYLLFKKYCDEAIEVLMATADQRPMANCIAKAIFTMPESVEKPYFYEQDDIVSAAKEICMKLQGLGLKSITA